MCVAQFEWRANITFSNKASTQCLLNKQYKQLDLNMHNTL